MQKEIGAVVGIAFLALVGLAWLPKQVVSAKTQPVKSEANRDSKPEQHQALSADLQKQVNLLKNRLLNTSGTDQMLAANQLIEVFVKANRYDSAAKYSESFLANDQSLSRKLGTADLYFQAANYALTEEKASNMAIKAREFYQKVLDENPNMLDVKTKMGMTFVTTGPPMQAISTLREVLDQEPNFEPALLNMGLLSLKSGQFDKAVARFRSVVKNNPESIEGRFYLGLSLLETKEVAEAKGIFNQLQKQKLDPAIKLAINEALQNIK